MINFDQVVEQAVTEEVSDIHISPQLSIYFRKHGQMYPVGPAIPGNEINRILTVILNSTHLDTFHERRQADFMYQTQAGHRVRGNAYMSNMGPSLCLRIVRQDAKSFDTLGFPDFVKQRILNLKDGLVLIVGPTGQGKSTSLASMLMERNMTKAEHIITLEDPIEYLLQPKKSMVQQREVGRDVLSLSDGLNAAMREDPDVIMVGEMRDTETIGSTLTMAETGHLVFGTLHTNNAHHTISRIVDSFGTDQQPQVRSQLAQNLRMVIAQRLIPRKDGNGRVLAYEIMTMNYAIANHIREDKVHQIPNAIQTDQSGEMILFEQSLASLVINDQITQAQAFEYSDDDDQLKSILEYNGVTVGK